MIQKRKVLLMVMILTAFLGVFSGCSSNKEETRVDLNDFYGISGDEYVVLVEGENVGKGIKIDDEVYISQSAVANEIDSRFFYDEDNNQIIWTTPTQIENIAVDGANKDIIKLKEEVYIKLDLVTKRSNIIVKLEDSPNRIYVINEFGSIEVSTAKESTYIRTEQSQKANVMADVGEGEKLVVKESKDNWYRVVNDKGISGFVLKDAMSETAKEERTSTFVDYDYTHISMDEKVCLGWHQMESQQGNDGIGEKIANATHLNVISPTWFKITDKSGNISSLASKTYVNKAHNEGLEVWALIDDFSYSDDGTYYIQSILKSTASRKNLITNIMEEVQSNEIDGINIDFENISLEYGKAYVQFIREISIECRNAGIVLSVDMYVPMSFNEYYGREDIGEVIDYIIIMGYDEHWAGCDSAGSVASLSYVTDGVVNTVAKVDPSRVINAIPFYTRIWSETPEEMAQAGDKVIVDAINGNYVLGSVAVGMDNAKSTLDAHNVEPIWLEAVGQYYGEYQEDGVTYRVWLEESKSIQAKLDVMDANNIAGVACWKLGLENNNIWDVIGEYLHK